MRTAAILAFLVLSAGLSHAQERPHWQVYRNLVYGFQIDLPYGQFVPQPSPTTASSLTLLESDGPGEISVYGGQNIHGADPAKLASVLGGADRVQAVTYRAEGNSWLVLSGYYKGATANTARVIFYAKLMFNRDRTKLSGFEISYPETQKTRFDPIIVRLERSLTPPNLRTR